MTETLQDRIIRHEGFCNFPKPDAKGMWVIGFGHDLTEQCAQEYVHGITTAEALDLLEKDIEIAKAAVSHKLPWAANLNEIRQEVLQEMCFQLGINSLLGFHSMLSCLQGNNFEGASLSMLHSLWHTQTPSRCEELANLILNGVENEQ